jgi:phosphohistidine phosphatase
MDLLIVRHAIAAERNPKRWPDDRERPLTPEGSLRARRAAAGLKRIADRPALLLTSPLVRARQSASILSECAGWPEPLECAALAPEASAEAVLKALQARPHERIAVVGHQPCLGQLIACCLPGEVHPQAIEIKKFGVALLSFNGIARPQGALLRWLLAPGVLRAVRR